MTALGEMSGNSGALPSSRTMWPMSCDLRIAPLRASLPPAPGPPAPRASSPRASSPQLVSPRFHQLSSCIPSLQRGTVPCRAKPRGASISSLISGQILVCNRWLRLGAGLGWAGLMPELQHDTARLVFRYFVKDWLCCPSLTNMAGPEACSAGSDSDRVP